MKYLKKKKRNGLKLTVAILAVLLVALLMLLLWLKTDSGNHEDGMTEIPETAPPTVETTHEKVLDRNGAENEMPNTTEDEIHNPDRIVTPYLTLYYNTSLSDCLTVVHNDGTPYRLEFYVVLEDKTEQRIFDILIGEGADGNLGVLKTNLGEVPASMVIYEFTPDENWTQDEINTVLAMQEVSNELIDQLMPLRIQNEYQGPELSAEQPGSNLSYDMEISTPFVSLLYPDKWESSLLVEQVEGETYQTLFYGALENYEPILLFTLIFGGDEGEQLGVLQDGQGQYIPVYLLMEEIDDTNYTENEMTILYEMQEAVNQLIDKLPLQ